MDLMEENIDLESNFFQILQKNFNNHRKLQNIIARICVDTANERVVLVKLSFVYRK